MLFGELLYVVDLIDGYFIPDKYRSRWVMHAATLLQLPGMISGSSLRRAKQVGGFKWD